MLAIIGYVLIDILVAIAIIICFMISKSFHKTNVMYELTIFMVSCALAGIWLGFNIILLYSIIGD